MRLSCVCPLALLLTLAASSVAAQAREPIIDMHLHADPVAYAGTNPPPMCTPFDRRPRFERGQSTEERDLAEGPGCEQPIRPAHTNGEVMRDTLTIMKKRNIIGMVSGDPAMVETWRSAAPERVIPGIDLRVGIENSGEYASARTVEALEQLYARGALAVLGEVMSQYEGIEPGDSRLESYWAFAEQHDIPVGIHLGPGGPGDVYAASSSYRARSSSPLALETVLKRHPRLRAYIMHAGYPFIADLRAVLFAHREVYVDISSIVYAESRPAFYNYLRGIIDAGFGDRVMFGSDQRVWPGVIEPSIAAIEDAPFLNAQQKRDILYNNAARFLRLSPQTIARHHAMAVGS